MTVTGSDADDRQRAVLQTYEGLWPDSNDGFPAATVHSDLLGEGVPFIENDVECGRKP